MPSGRHAERIKKSRHDPSSQGGSSSSAPSGRSLRPRQPKRAAEQQLDDVDEEENKVVTSSSQEDVEDETFQADPHGKEPADNDSDDEAPAGDDGEDDESDEDGRSDNDAQGDAQGQVIYPQPNPPNYNIWVRPTDYSREGMTEHVRRLRKEDPHMVERTTASDYRFWTVFQQDVYSSVILRKSDITMSAQWVDMEFLKNHQNAIATQIYNTCKTQGIYHLMKFRHYWNKELVAQFYATIFFGYHENDRAIFWRTEGRPYFLTFQAFRGLFQLDNAANLDVIHNRKPLEPKEMHFMYPKNTPISELGKVNKLYTYYGVLYRMFRKTISPRGGNTTDVSRHMRNLLWYMREGAP